jgi:hypothetical protein
MTESPDDIVGHSTHTDGKGGRWHEPLTRAVADALWASAIAAKEKRAADMPDVETALRTLTDAYQRLTELGFSGAQYGKKQNVMVELIEPGCSAVQRGYWRYHDGKDGAGCFWIPADGDEWPSHPILSRALPTGGELPK